MLVVVKSLYYIYIPYASKINIMITRIDLCVRIYPKSDTLKVNNDALSIINLAG